MKSTTIQAFYIPFSNLQIFKYHAHGKRLFPAGRAALEAPIQVKSHSGKVTEILQ